MTNVVHVAVGAIRRQGKILIAKRPEHVHQGGCWEFPGGKIEAQESVEQALIRELKEELDIEPQNFSPLIQIPFRYPQKQVLLDVYCIDKFIGDPKGLEGQPIQWVDQKDLGKFQFPPANHAILSALSLPQFYMITPASVGKDFLLKLEESFKMGISLFQLRHQEIITDFLLDGILGLVEEYHVAMQINSNSWEKYLTRRQRNRLLAQHKNDCPIGFHLTSRDLQGRKDYSELCGLQSASCHTLDDIDLSNRRQMDFVVVSPVAITSSHPQQSPLGWEGFKQLCQDAQLPVYALGGMKKNDLGSASRAGAQGIAAISGLWGNITDV